MISYELAKKLKDAGFPQEGKGEHKNEVGMSLGSFTVFGADKLKLGTYCYFPTLSELIEACGDDFGCLMRYEKQWRIIDKKNLDERIGTGIKGDTPEEAVARLWLALQEKHVYQQNNNPRM